MDEIWELYADDGAQALDTAEAALQMLQGAEGAAPSDQIASLFRAIHTFKGNARVLGLATVENRAHLAEDLIGLVRDDGAPLTRNMIDVLWLAVDMFRSMLEETASSRADVDPGPIEKLVGFLNDEIAKAKAPRAEEAPEGVAAPPLPDPVPTLPPEPAAPPSAPAPVADKAREPPAMADVPMAVDSLPAALSRLAGDILTLPPEAARTALAAALAQAGLGDDAARLAGLFQSAAVAAPDMPQDTPPEHVDTPTEGEINGLIVRAGDVWYVLPLNAVERVLQPDDVQHLPVSAETSAQRVRVTGGETLPLRPLATSPRPGDGALIVVVRTKGQSVAVPVDELQGQQQVQLCPLRGVLANLPDLCSTAILTSGVVGMVVSVGKLAA